MTSNRDEILKKLNRRVERLNEEYKLNAPDIIISNELNLVEDAIKELRKFIKVEK